MELKLVEAKINDKTSNGGPRIEIGGHNVGLFFDTETGVEYFIMNSTNAGAICPRLDRNGNPVVFPGFKG